MGCVRSAITVEAGIGSQQCRCKTGAGFCFLVGDCEPCDAILCVALLSVRCCQNACEHLS